METLSLPRHPARNPRHAGAKGGQIIDAEAVREVLDEVLASAPFCHTQQCKNLLCYIVKHSLSQEEHLLRERVIGAEVFGRPPNYETGDDPVVRIRAAEVRKRLAQFYQSLPDTHATTVQIEIPSGSYRAVFRWREGLRPAAVPSPELAEHVVDLPAAEGAPVLPVPHIVPSLPVPVIVQQADVNTRWWKAYSGLLQLMAVVLVLVIAALVYALVPSAEMRAFNRFWAPWTGNSKPIIFSIGSNAVYRLSDEFVDSYARDRKLENHGMEFFVPTGPDTVIKGTDVRQARDSFVALGDVDAISALVATVTRSGQTFQERFPNDISFAELRDTPTVLVGGFNNPMTLELTKDLPFVLAARNEIKETKPGGRQWILKASNDSRDTEDYAIVTRLAQRNGDAPILSVAGMGQYGTLAAASFICNPASVAQITHRLSMGWSSRNLQVVLHVRVVDFKAQPPEIVALQVW
jgi:hypothetical protein